MPTLVLNLKTAGRRASRIAQGSTYENVYIGRTDVATDAATVESLVPSATPDHFDINDPHPINPVALVTAFDVEADGDSKVLWKVTVRWEPPTLSGSTPANPLDRPPEVRWGSELETRTFFQDFTPPGGGGPKHIVNSAGERFDDLPQREFGVLTLQYTRNESSATFDVVQLSDHMVVANSDAFTIDGYTIAAGMALMYVSEAPKITEGSTTYYRVTYNFRIKADNWLITRILDVGYNAINIDELTPILDIDGMPVRKPWPLDGAGVPMPNPTDPPAELEFQFYESRDFAPFNFV